MSTIARRLLARLFPPRATTFIRCLAMHIANAGPRSALTDE
jgi:hypothetical protein